MNKQDQTPIKRLIPNQRTHQPGDWYRAVVLLYLRHGFATAKAMGELLMRWWNIPPDRWVDALRCSAFSHGRFTLQALENSGKIEGAGPKYDRLYRVTKEGIEDITRVLHNPDDLLACLEDLKDGGLKDSLAVHAARIRGQLDLKVRAVAK